MLGEVLPSWLEQEEWDQFERLMRLVHVALDNSHQICDNKREPCAQTCHITDTMVGYLFGIDYC